MTSGNKHLCPSLNFKINQAPQQLLLPESKISVSGVEGGARVLVGDHTPLASTRWKVVTAGDTHRRTHSTTHEGP